MSTTFIVETGTGLSNANAFITIAEADQIMENYGNSTDWSNSTEAQKQNAIREATRYLNLQYAFDGYKTLSTQALQFPRIYIYDEDGNAIDSNVLPERLKESCAYLALQERGGDTLLEDFDNESKVKKTKDVVGPLTEEREYVHGEDPDKTYRIVDKLVFPYLLNQLYSQTDIERS